MALDTYSDLIEEVGNTLVDASLVPHIPNMIQRAERRLERSLNIIGNEAMVRLDLVMGRAPLPDDYASWRTVSAKPGWSLDYVAPHIFLAQFGRAYGITVPAQGDGYDDEAFPPDGGGRPGFFTIVGSVPLDDIEVSPEVWPYSLSNPFILASPAGGNRVTLIYRQGIAPLGTGNTTNWLLAKEPDLYLYATLFEAAMFLGLDARAATFKGSLDEGMNEVARLDRDARWGRSRIMTTEPTP